MDQNYHCTICNVHYTNLFDLMMHESLVHALTTNPVDGARSVSIMFYLFLIHVDFNDYAYSLFVSYSDTSIDKYS